MEVTYAELYNALRAGLPVEHAAGSAPHTVLKLVPTGAERYEPSIGALVQLAPPVGEPFWVRGEVCVPVRPRRPVVPTQ
jgi:hypothetical protein